jgi:2-methylisocitrate lyase-like PEP mutase family enzyme
MGYKLVIFAPLGLFVVIRAVQEAMTQLKEDPSYVSIQNKMVSIRGSGEAVDIHTWLELERRYAVETA